jgi:hypothetical protein
MNSPRAIAAQNVCDTSATMCSENLTHNTLNQSGVAITDRTQGTLTDTLDASTQMNKPVLCRSRILGF